MENFIKITLAGVLCLVTVNIQAQVITNVPSNTGNDRDYSEAFAGMERPGLSAIGFDNGGNSQHGLGLKQILNEAYSTGTNQLKETIGKILALSKEDIEFVANNDDAIQFNSIILQYKAFEAVQLCAGKERSFCPRI